jgi:hypothetical protein
VPDLQFHIEGAETVAFAAAPMLALKLGINNASENEPIHSVSLNCQVQIEPAHRHYVSQEQEKLLDLFGEPDRWSRTVRPLLWMNTTVSVSGFTNAIAVDLNLPCSFDFNVAATKYFYALEAGDIPVCVLFSGTIFYCSENGALQVAPVPWNREANYRIPAVLWKQMMDTYYPNSAWLRLERNAFDRLYTYKMRHGIPTWEQLLDVLLASKEDDEVPV